MTRKEFLIAYCLTRASVLANMNDVDMAALVNRGNTLWNEIEKKDKESNNVKAQALNFSY